MIDERLEPNIVMGARCKIEGYLPTLGKGEITLGDDVVIGESVVIKVSENLVIGDRSHIGDFFKIEGRDIKIGKEFHSGRYCGIGGGSSHEKLSSLRIGDQCHLGDFGFINTAREVIIGDEVGLGQQTRVYTHGAYQSFIRGFPVEFGPVTIEDRVWCPNAIILPNVTIGHDTVVAAGAVVTGSLPSGCLAGGVPAKVIRENCYPTRPDASVIHPNDQVKMLEEFLRHFTTNIQSIPHLEQVGLKIFVDQTLFDLHEMKIEGPANDLTERFKNELRRYGVRFRYYNRDGTYAAW